MLDFRLTPEQVELQKKAREFAREEILPSVWYFDEKDEMPLSIIMKAYEAGLMNLSVPPTYGGKGLGILDQAVLVEEIAAACLGVATSIFDNSLGEEPIILSRNEAVKQHYLSEIVKTFSLISFATSEPVMGSDVAGMQCRAEKDGSEWVLTGTKYWVTNGGYADYYSIFANADPASRHKGICAFLVEKNWEGVTIGKPIPKLGLRTSNTVGIHFDYVRVPAENVLAEPGEGFILAMKTFSHTRPIIGAFATGAARSAMEIALAYAKKRRAFQTEIATFQATQFKLAEMFQKVETTRLLTWKAAWEADNGMDPTISASLSKFYGSEAALQVVNDALQVLGGYGYTKFYPLEKLYRDVRVLTIYEGTSEIQRTVVGRHALEKYQPVLPLLEEISRVREEKRGEKAWRCRICGYIHYGDQPPENCPYCFFPQSTFLQV